MLYLIASIRECRDESKVSYEFIKYQRVFFEKCLAQLRFFKYNL